jgi:isopenicillin N synthase-like dioxygenase
MCVSKYKLASIEYGFFYLVNHGVDEDFIKQVFEESAKFFSLPIQSKIILNRKEYRARLLESRFYLDSFCLGKIET